MSKFKVGDTVRVVKGVFAKNVGIIADSDNKYHYHVDIRGVRNFVWFHEHYLELVEEQSDPYAELKKAHAEGKTIQGWREISSCGQGRWHDVHVPSWCQKPSEYRVKPEEPRLVPDGDFRVGELHVIVGRPGAGASHFMSTEVAKQKSTNQQKEKPMQLKLTTRHYLNGKDVTDLDLSQIYNAISNAEGSIRQLETIENKPKRLVAEIAQRKADLKALVEFLDAQDA